MSLPSAWFFSFVQATDFYRKLHREAVALLPSGAGRTWLDVGCGPGLVTLLAAERGYHATGIDIDPKMIRRAAIEARQSRLTATFKVGSLAELPTRAESADVVSAASLLALTEDRTDALRMLLSAISPNGTLLVVEPSDRMTPEAAADARSIRPLSRDSAVLRLWARTRIPARAVGWREMRIDGYETLRYDLLDGLVNAWIIRAVS